MYSYFTYRRLIIRFVTLLCALRENVKAKCARQKNLERVRNDKIFRG